MEISALVTKRPGENKRNDEKGKLWFDFYNRPRHARVMCWKLHGKPPNLKQLNENRGQCLRQANQIATEKAKLCELELNSQGIAWLH